MALQQMAAFAAFPSSLPASPDTRYLLDSKCLQQHKRDPLPLSVTLSWFLGLRALAQGEKKQDWEWNSLLSLLSLATSLTQLWARLQLLCETVLFTKPAKPMNNFQFTKSLEKNQNPLMWKGGNEWIQVGLPMLSAASYQITVLVNWTLTSSCDSAPAGRANCSILPHNLINIKKLY